MAERFGRGTGAGAGAGGGGGLRMSWRSWIQTSSESSDEKMEERRVTTKCTRHAGNECGRKILEFAGMGLKSEAPQPLKTRKTSQD